MLGVSWMGAACGWVAILASMVSAVVTLLGCVTVYSVARFTAIEVGLSTLHRVFLGSGGGAGPGAGGGGDTGSYNG